MFNNSYVGRVYLSDEISGKEFIAGYPSKRGFLADYFKDSNFVFDLNVDVKTHRKIKNMQRKVGQIVKGIKNANDLERKVKARPMNSQPLDHRNPMMFGGMPGINMGMMNGGMMMNPQSMGMNQPTGTAPGMRMGNTQTPQMGGQIDPIKDMKNKIGKIIRDKEKVISDGAKN